MDANELRTLADALDRITFPVMGLEELHYMETLDRTADYLRACADAKPVARLLHWHGPKPDPRTVIVARTFDEYSVQEADDPKSYWKNGEPLYTHPAPAVPQAEPIADSDADYWLRNRQAILDAIERAGFVLMSNASGFWLHPRGTTDAQAEPKREPLSDERIDKIQRAAYERAAQECLATAAELRRCADGCTDGRYDWKADGADDCADAIRALGRQHD